MNRKKAAPYAYTATPLGEQVLTATLAEKLRSFRGRLSRVELCAAMEWPPTPANYGLIYKLCMRWEIATQDTVREKRDFPVNQLRREREIELAAKVRTEQIALARIEATTAPPYKGGDLQW